MKLKDFPKNASCDMSNGEPKALEAGGGFCTIRFNVVPKIETTEDGEQKQVGYDYSEVHFAYNAQKGIKSEAKRNIINAAYTIDEEEALKHQADAVAAKIIVDEHAEAKYLEFLQFRADIDLMLNNIDIVENEIFRIGY